MAVCNPIQLPLLNSFTNYDDLVIFLHTCTDDELRKCYGPYNLPAQCIGCKTTANTNQNGTATCEKCRRKMDVNTTWLHRLLVEYPPKPALKVLYLFCVDIPQFEVPRILGPEPSQAAIQRLFDRFRQVCNDYVSINPIQFDGAIDMIVDPYMEAESPDEPTGMYEIDEMKPGKKAKYHRGTSRQSQHWLFGMVERSSGKCFAVLVPNRRKKTIRQIVQSRVSTSCHINHDSYASYSFLDELNYSHSAVNHSREFKAADGTHTNTIEGIWGLLRQRITRMHGCKGTYNNTIIQEFCFRRSYQQNGSIWMKLLSICAP